MNYTYYHNPRCSKSRLGLEFLKEKGVNPKVIEYLKTGLQLTELLNIQKKLNMLPLEGMIRIKEKSFKEKGLDKKDLSKNEWLEEIVKNPILLERPILLCDKGAQIGRPTENFLKIL